MNKRLLAALFPVVVMAVSVIPSVFATTTYTSYDWNVSCNGNGAGTATGSWYWYVGGPTGSSLASGVVSCTGTGSAAGPCPSQGVCSLGRPSNADTLVVVVNIDCGTYNHKSASQSFTPGSPVSITVSQSIKRGNCNGTYDRGTQSGTITVTA